MIHAVRKRRLVAILFTDIVGYSALTGQDEILSLELIEEHQAILRKVVAKSGGSEVKSTGDGFLFEFSSVVEAVQASLEIQTLLFERNLTVPDERKLRIRIGVHLGDILDSNDDFHGNEVNVAARIEPLATPGGIAITRAVADQLRGKLELSLHSLGAVKLKNIAHAPEVFQIRMPWDASRASVFKRTRDFLTARGRGKSASAWTVQGGLVAAQLAGVIALIAWTIGAVLVADPMSVDVGPSRTPGFSSAPVAAEGEAGSAQANAADPAHGSALPEEWRFAIGRNADDASEWKRFPLENPLAVADELKGEYTLRLDFPTPMEFHHPTIVIGLISDAHRTYLNGRFVGGSSTFSNLAKYSFDPSLLRGEGKGPNRLVVRAKSRATLTPGIYPIPDGKPFIADFEAAERIVTRNDSVFHVLQTLYLGVSLLVALASLAYALVRRSALRYAYYSLFLFLGAIGLSFYSRDVIAALDFPIYRWMRLTALAWSCFTLGSLALRDARKRSWEITNNGAALAFAAFAFVALVVPDLAPTRFFERYRIGFQAVTVYSVVLVALVVGATLRRAFRKRGLDDADGFAVRGSGALVQSAFGVLLAALSASAAFGGASSWVRVLGMVYPFAFAILVASNAILDSIRKSREVEYQRRRHDFLLWISTELEAEDSDDPRLLARVHEKIMGFVHATRSTLYLTAGSAQELRAHLRVGVPTNVSLTNADSATETRNVPSAAPEPGIAIGAPGFIVDYVVRHRTPAWVEDIATDSRFAAYHATRWTESTYRTGSFIALPLFAGKELLGVLTVADRADSKSFTREDFELLHLAGRGVSALISRRRESWGESAAKLRLVS